MDILTAVFWAVALILTVISMVKDRKKTVLAMKQAKGMMSGMLSDIVAIIFLIGLILTFLPPETIRTTLNETNTLVSTLLAALAGSVTLIPAFVAFPLIGSLVDAGADKIPAVAFLTTLTMVGVVTFPLERKEFGTKLALTRNLLSFLFAIIIALSMGVLL